MKQHTEIHSPALVAANTRKFKGTAYLVGGAVRDKLMGLEPKDQDYVVVGGDEESMLAAGFLPVGKDFPVFLHPDTREEYALARKERKTGAGYRGFSCEFGREITLEDDLFRRDLTINAMAMTAEGVLHDPYGGAKDLNEKVLRHVSEHFREDPVRILRIARFSARYGFNIAKDTMNFLKEMVTSGEFNSLQPERVWAELSKAHTEKEPGRFWQALKIAGASEKLPGFYVDSQWPERSARILTDNHPQWHSHRLACSLQAVAIETIDLWKSDALTKERYGQWQYLLTLPPWHKASVDEKLAINKRLRAQQDPEKSSWLVYDVLITQGLKEEAEWARSAFLYDLTLLNNLDYASITRGLKGEKIKTMIEEAQKESLQIKNTNPTTKGLVKNSSLRKK